MGDAPSERYPHLMSPGTIGGVAVLNRIVQMPMGTGMMHDGRVTEGDIAFMEERARGGVGLIITGASPVHETSIVAGRILTEAWDDDGRDLLRRRVDAVHAHGTKIFGQILHLGRESSGDTMAGGATEYVPLAPSAIASPRDPSPPHEMTTAEVRWMIGAFGRAATNLQAAGYDGIEIQACHGYLVAQFLTPSSNRRLDTYRGDTLDGRMRFLVEVIEEVRALRRDIPDRGPRQRRGPRSGRSRDRGHARDRRRTAAPGAGRLVSVTTGVRGAYVKDTTFGEGFARGSRRPSRRASTCR